MENCKGCGHTLENNRHGIDQNDIWEDENGKLRWTSCTYCKFCNPRIETESSVGPRRPLRRS